MSALASGSRDGAWPASISRPSALLVCTMLATAGVTAASVLLTQRFMRGSTRPRTWSSGL